MESLTLFKTPRHNYAVGPVHWFISRRICHAPRRVRGLQKPLLAKLSQLRGVGRTVRRRAAPKSTGALAREFIVCPRFRCETACQSRFRGRVYRSKYDDTPYPSSRRAPCRWASHPTRAVNSCTVYSVVENSQEVLLLTI